MKTLGIIVGSLRENSYSKQVSDVVASHLSDKYNIKYLNISKLPLYNEDLETETPPAEWTAFRKELKETDALLFVTPEYNRSMPAALKNALDVGSRPYGSNLFDGKPAGIIAQSPGAYGGFGANHHLRQSLVFLNVYPLQQPEMYLAKSNEMFDEQGKIVERSDKFIQSFALALDTWIQKF